MISRRKRLSLLRHRMNNRTMMRPLHRVWIPSATEQVAHALSTFSDDERGVWLTGHPMEYARMSEKGESPFKQELTEDHSVPLTTPPDETPMRLKKVVHEPKMGSGKNNRRRCRVCYLRGKTKKIHSQCVTCGVFLCFESCWEDWHSLRTLKTEEPQLKREHIENEVVG